MRLHGPSQTRSRHFARTGHNDHGTQGQLQRTGKPQRTAAIENPPQAVQWSVARALHLTNVPAQRDQRHLGAKGQYRSRRILDQSLRPGRRFRRCRRQECADVLRAQDVAKLARGEDGSAGTAPSRSMALTDYKRDLEARSANLTAPSIRACTSQCAAVEAGGVVKPTELRNGATACWARWHRHHQPALPLYMRRALAAGTTAHRTAMHGGSDSPVCRMTEVRNVSLRTTKPRVCRHRLRARSSIRAAVEVLAVTGARPRSPFGSVSRTCRSSCTAEADDAKVREGGGGPQPKKTERWCRSPQLAAKLSGGKRPCRRLPLLLQSDGSAWDKIPARTITASGQGRHRHRARPCRRCTR